MIVTRLSHAFSKSHPTLVCFLTAGGADTAANLDALVERGEALFTAADKLGVEI